MAIVRVREVRIHGVSGTPARSMLRTEPVITDLGGDYTPANRIEVFGRPEVTGDIDGRPLQTVAYRWGRLTAGRLRQAFWILLLPYTLINAAGWMLPDPGGRWSRILTGLVRMAGVAVTANFVLLASIVSMELIAVRCRLESVTCRGPLEGTDLSVPWLLGGALVPILLVLVLYLVIGRDKATTRVLDEMDGVVSEPEPTGTGDPAQHLTITDRALWDRHPVEKQLGLLHIAVSIWAMAVVLVIAHATFVEGSVAGRSVVGSAWTAWGIIPLVVSPALIVATVISSVRDSHGGRFGRLCTVSVWTAGIGLLVVGATMAGDGDLGTTAGEMARSGELTQLPGLQETLLVMVALLGGIGVLLYVVTGLTDNWRHAIGPAAMLVLAGLFGAAFGSGVNLLAESALVESEEGAAGFPGMEWIAVGFLIVLLATMAVALALVAWFLVRSAGGRHTRLFTGLSETAHRVRVVLVVAGVVGLTGGVTFIAMVVRFRWSAPIPPLTNRVVLWIVLVLAATVIFGALILVASYLRPGWKWSMWVAAAVVMTGLGIAAGAVALAVSNTSVFDRLIPVATWLAVVFPTSLIVGRMVTGVRKPDSQRAVGVLWDLGSFWPRWYHPFSAPYYTPVAVPDLQRLISASLRGDGADRCLVVAAHSQGSVIAMATLLTLRTTYDMTPEEMRRIGLITYGSPITKLYGTMFPAHFDPSTVAALCAELSDAVDPPGTPVVRWRNLFRITDPIGGAVGVAAVDVGPLPDPDEGGHSGYEGLEIYAATRAELVGMVADVAPPTADPPDALT